MFHSFQSNGNSIQLQFIFDSFQYLSMPQFNKSFEENDGSEEVSAEKAESASETPTTSSASTKVIYTKLSKLPKHVDEMKRSGNEFMENEKYLQAINQYSECIKLLPNHPVFYLNRATAYMRRNWFGDMYSGLRDCQQALRLDPTYVKAHFRLARALFELGFVMEASECLDELKKRFPNDATNKQIQLLAQDIQSHIEVNRRLLIVRFINPNSCIYCSNIDVPITTVRAQTPSCLIMKWFVRVFSPNLFHVCLHFATH